jgi:hypothetical protein
MSTNRVETLPAIWDDARDIPFFRITARLFTPEFCLGASVLLASYDDDVHGDTRTIAPVITGVPQHDRDLTSVRRSR